MPDRNELIASLEGRIWGGEMHKGGYIHVPQEEAEAILKLLKAKEPRVLTFDELMALPHGREDNACVVLEEKIPVDRWDGGTIWKWTGAAFVQERAEDHRIYNRDSYGKVWRCWNTKPTKEQREGMKWND